ncbi:class II aldolase/adducin family protein [Haliangium ochraceum]|uniref:Class II aldolase/adducin family protein n=1 Tax=Haliangium ochraceum (strain DSM 14365 / JCM 11303 / SMP-2) TaxID=502025 RepID=D0LNL6_HALO1|nr:class II aldolase/adducin family protein [Haliangium ochraceum]ACY16921.1 class II aldolase/adducin family protein [Haliangium ochraceum DSM 14365]
MQAPRQLRKQMIDTARLLHERGWVANHDGNLTVRLGANRFLATPTATSKRLVDDGNLIEVDAAGKRLAGTARPFSEFNLHRCIYERRSDVGAVLHAHPPKATAIACSAENPIERPFIAEAVVSIGPRIPKVPFAAPGPDAAAAVAPFATEVDAVLLGNHGVLAWGADLELAYLRLELVEHLATIALAALPLGGPQPLPEAALPKLLQARARAGLGQAADAATQHAHAYAAAPRQSASESASGGGRDDLVRVIREELVRALAGEESR